MRFGKIRQYLCRMRNAAFTVLIDEGCLFQFEIKNKYCEKLFTVHYRDGSMRDKLNGERPAYCHYYLQFEQENVPTRGRFSTVREWKWYQEEEDVLQRIKTLKNRYNY